MLRVGLPVGAAFPARLASESVAGRQPRYHCFNDFNDFNDLTNRRIDKNLLELEFLELIIKISLTDSQNLGGAFSVPTCAL